MGDLYESLSDRFGADVARPLEDVSSQTLLDLAARRSHRKFRNQTVSLELLRMLSAVALSAPSKSDLQQRDIIIVRDAGLKADIAKVVTGQAWVASAPELLIFCGNNRRQRQLHAWRGHEFVNDHLDAFFNAAVDAGIALQAFITAAESVGLGCCPISGVRNDCEAVSEALALPDHVFPVAGLGVGWPSADGVISQRLPLQATVHVDGFDDTDIEGHIDGYDTRRHAVQPYGSQRQVERFGELETYTWSEDKARQYAAAERQDFGAFVLGKGFKLE